jgi:hypothetical protein
MEKIPNKVFHGSPEKFSSEEAVPSRQIRTEENEEGIEVVIFDEESFHATPEKWIALAYTDKPSDIDRDGIKGKYSMAVSLYDNNKTVLIIGIGSLEESLQALYGEGGYLYHFDDETFVYKEGLGNLEVVSNETTRPLEIERIDNPAEEMINEGVKFEFVDISLPENSKYRTE